MHAFAHADWLRAWKLARRKIYMGLMLCRTSIFYNLWSSIFTEIMAVSVWLSKYENESKHFIIAQQKFTFCDLPIPCQITTGREAFFCNLYPVLHCATHINCTTTAQRTLKSILIDFLWDLSRNRSCDEDVNQNWIEHWEMKKWNYKVIDHWSLNQKSSKIFPLMSK